MGRRQDLVGRIFISPRLTMGLAGHLAPFSHRSRCHGRRESKPRNRRGCIIDLLPIAEARHHRTIVLTPTEARPTAHVCWSGGPLIGLAHVGRRIRPADIPIGIVSGRLLERGRLGRKNGKGFYDYPEKGKGQKKLWPELSTLQPKHLDPDTIDVEELKQRFLVVQAVEAARTVEDHVITDPREADVGSILGFGFAPFTGGTLSYIDFMGTKTFVELCQKLEKKYGPRFAPPKLLLDMAAKGETFYSRFAPPKAA